MNWTPNYTDKCKKFAIRFTSKTHRFQNNSQLLNSRAARVASQNLAVLCVKRISFFVHFSMLDVVHRDTRVLRTKFSFLINACFLNVFSFIYFTDIAPKSWLWRHLAILRPNPRTRMWISKIWIQFQLSPPGRRLVLAQPVLPVHIMGDPWYEGWDPMEHPPA